MTQRLIPKVQTSRKALWIPQLQHIHQEVDVLVVLVMLVHRCRSWRRQLVPQKTAGNTLVKVVDFPVVQDVLDPQAQVVEKDNRHSTVCRSLRTSLWRPMLTRQTSERLGTVPVRHVGTDRVCGGGRDQENLRLHNLYLPCSSRHPSWSLLLLLWSRYSPLPLWSTRLQHPCCLDDSSDHYDSLTNSPPNCNSVDRQGANRRRHSVVPMLYGALPTTYGAVPFCEILV